MKQGKKIGTVYLVGAGPGDPGLITKRGIEYLNAAKVVVYDYLVSKELLSYAPGSAEMIYVGKKSKDHTLPQTQIEELLVNKAKEGKEVVRLKGGDPSIFGRVGEEAEYLVAHNVPFVIVPGISSAIAVPAYAGIPVTHREKNSELVIVTGHEGAGKEKTDIDWQALARGKKTIIFLMGIAKLADNMQRLLAEGIEKTLPVALIEWGTTNKQRSCLATVETIVSKAAAEKIKAPAICIIGNVVQLREKLNWFEKRPLFGQTVLVTRARKQAEKICTQLSSLGARVINLPAIEIKARPFAKEWKNYLEKLSTSGWLIFTSVNAVELFFQQLYEEGLDSRFLHKLKVAAIGPKTAESCKKYGIVIDKLSKQFTAEGLLAVFAAEKISGNNFFLPRAAEARVLLAEELAKAGGNVFEYKLYDTVIPAESRELMQQIMAEDEPDWITFTSGSTVRNFLDLYAKKKISKKTKIVSIGPITSEELKKAGYTVAAEAKEFTVEGLLAAMLNEIKV